MNGRKSFTLAEIAVMSGVGMLIFFGIIKVMTSGMRGAQHGMEKLETLQELALFLNTFQADLRHLTKIVAHDPEKLVFLTRRFSKNSQAKVSLEMTYELKKSGGRVAGLEATPRPLSGNLPADITPRRFFEKNLKSWKFLDLKNDRGVPLPIKGIALEIQVNDEATGAALDFQRTFFPPLLPENNPEDGYLPLPITN